LLDVSLIIDAADLEDSVEVWCWYLVVEDDEGNGDVGRSVAAAGFSSAGVLLRGA
jgi:hypothetical protein